MHYVIDDDQGNRWSRIGASEYFLQYIEIRTVTDQ